MSRNWLRLHRGLALAMAAFWLLQALTGILLVYRWEIEDALLPGSAVEADPAALGARIEVIALAGGTPVDVWASADSATRFDIYYSDAFGSPRTMRVDGAGQVLRDVADTGRIANGEIFDTLTELHTKLLSGETGSWIIAASGLLLLTGVVLGLRLAWPRANGWGRALLRKPAGPPAARLYGWHRSLGLWIGLLILPFLAAGILLCFEPGLRERADAEIPVPEPRAEAVRITPTAALSIAAKRYPDATLSALVLPENGRPWYRVRQRRPGDLARNWGTSTLFVSSVDGRILGDHPAARAPTRRKLIDTIYPFHTGQFAGSAGRTFVLLQGIWLITMIVLGLQLWWARRRAR